MAQTRAEKSAWARARYATAEGREKHNARVRRWRQANPHASREISRRCRYKAIATRPEPDTCESCGRFPEHGLCFDHDHVTGKFRGWICSPCNRSIGQLGDNLEGVEKAAAYLRRAA